MGMLLLHMTFQFGMQNLPCYCGTVTLKGIRVRVIVLRSWFMCMSVRVRICVLLHHRVGVVMMRITRFMGVGMWQAVVPGHDKHDQQQTKRFELPGFFHKGQNTQYSVKFQRMPVLFS